MDEDRKYRVNLLISIVALTLAVIVVGGIYVRDMFSDNNRRMGNGSQSVSPPVRNSSPVVHDNPKVKEEAIDTFSSEPLDTISVKEKPSEAPEKTVMVKNRAPKNEYGHGKGRITIYRICSDCKPAQISLDGNPLGNIGNYQGNGPPGCASGGTLSKVVEAGRHHISVSDDSGNSRDFMITIPEGKCVLQKVDI